MTLQVDLDLESADPVQRFCTLFHGEEHLGEDHCKSFKGAQEVLREHKIEG